jgi:hypothetical protein
MEDALGATKTNTLRVGQRMDDRLSIIFYYTLKLNLTYLRQLLEVHKETKKEHYKTEWEKPWVKDVPKWMNVLASQHHLQQNEVDLRPSFICFSLSPRIVHSKI